MRKNINYNNISEKTEVVTVIGTFRATTKGFGFVQPDEQDTESTTEIFVPAVDRRKAWDGDKVACEIVEQATRDRKAEGRIVKIISRGTTGLIGTFKKSNNFGFVVPDDKKFEEDIFISKEHTKGARDNSKVYVTITDYGGKNKRPEGRVTEILGDMDDPHTDLTTALRQYNIFPEFSMEVIQEAMDIADEVPDEDKVGRFDMRDFLTVTIDGADAKDLDDAITIERTESGYSLGVHIADVSHYVKEETALDDEAYLRGTSVYLINRVIPMLPKKLSNGICSLNAGKDRLVLSCIMDIDTDGRIVGHRIDETLINVTRRMTYDEVQEIISVCRDGASGEGYRSETAIREEYGPLTEKFLLMKELSDKMRAIRKQRGAIDFDFLESKITLDDTDAPLTIEPYLRNNASMIIEDFMLAANETVAEDFFWQEIPFLYRSHETPDEEKIKKLLIFVKNYGVNIRGAKDNIHPKEIQKMLEGLKGKDEEALISRLTLRSMKQAKYTVDCDGHFGLATKYYCHFTSPIRRYPDLQIHRIIKDNLNGRLNDSRKTHYASILDEVAEHTSATERNAEAAERDVERMKCIEYMQMRIGNVYEGVISGLTNWGIYVELPNTVEGMVSLQNLKDDYYKFDSENYILYGEKKHKTYTLGQKVYIKVEGADKLTKTIDFSIIGGRMYNDLKEHNGVNKVLTQSMDFVTEPEVSEVQEEIKKWTKKTTSSWKQTTKKHSSTTSSKKNTKRASSSTGRKSSRSARAKSPSKRHS